MPALRYAILWHDDIDQPHFDLMFETLPGSMLATWRSPVWPIEQLTPLVRLKDHRRDFLEYEGELTGHRGRVRRVAGGICKLHIDENSVGSIHFLNAVPPITLTLCCVNGQNWQIAP